VKSEKHCREGECVNSSLDETIIVHLNPKNDFYVFLLRALRAASNFYAVSECGSVAFTSDSSTENAAKAARP
jgi:hypothetical protein